MSGNSDFKRMKKDELVAILEAHWQDIQNANSTILNIKAKVSEIESYTEQVKTLSASATTIQTGLTAKQVEITATSTEIKKIKIDIDDSQQAITGYYNELFGDEDTDVKSIETQIQEKKSEFESLFTEYKTKSEERDKQISTDASRRFELMESERLRLFEKIDSLLPSATSAGLASSYKHAQDEIKSLPLLWFAFFAVIMVLFLWYASFFYSRDYSRADHSLSTVLAHILTGTPLIWLILYLQKSISQKSHIVQEYNHKQRVMNLYEGFVRAIDESGSEDQKLELLTIMLDTVKSNPADIMHKHETLIEKITTKIKIPFLKNKSDRIEIEPPND